MGKQQKEKKKPSSTRVLKDILTDMKNARNFLLSAIESHQISSSYYYNHASAQPTFQIIQSTPIIDNTESLLLSSRVDDDNFCHLETPREEAEPVQCMPDTDAEESDHHCSKDEFSHYGELVSYSKNSNSNHYYYSWMYASTN